MQSVAVRLVCEREQEIQAFVSEEYWTIEAVLEGSESALFQATLARIDSQKAEIKNEGEAQASFPGSGVLPFSVKDVERKERRKNPSPPYITSQLQQEAWRKLRFTAKKTMAIAQRLYEGIELGPGRTRRPDHLHAHGFGADLGRTPCRRCGSSSREKFGAGLSARETQCRTRAAKTAQEAHEAIRPTSVKYEPEAVKSFLSKDQFALYELIWNRFVASQMNPAVYDQTSVDIEAGKYTSSGLRDRSFSSRDS